MKMFSECAWKCHDCTASIFGGCLAGHGDDDYHKVTEEHLTYAMTNTSDRIRKYWKLYGIDTRVIEIFPHLKERIENFMNGVDI